MKIFWIVLIFAALVAYNCIWHQIESRDTHTPFRSVMYDTPRLPVTIYLADDSSRVFTLPGNPNGYTLTIERIGDKPQQHFAGPEPGEWRPWMDAQGEMD